jgi:hypothetical protein
MKDTAKTQQKHSKNTAKTQQRHSKDTAKTKLAAHASLLIAREYTGRDDIAFHPSSLGLYRLPHQLLYAHSRFEKRRVTLAAP